MGGHVAKDGGRPVVVRADKRRDLLSGALIVFARDGYARASIDVIAREAGVSTRTIYNQFGGKAALFQTVIQDSAQRVGDTHIAIMDRYLGKVTEVEADLIEFARAFAEPTPEFVPHFALVRQINADVEHVPPAAFEAWQQTGPLRVRKHMAGHLRRMADAGLLHIDDAYVAAGHLMLLIGGDVNARSHHGAQPISRREIHRLADAGVRTFLYGHAGSPRN
jgi:AcrR family transcriptional regulator